MAVAASALVASALTMMLAPRPDAGVDPALAEHNAVRIIRQGFQRGDAPAPIRLPAPAGGELWVIQLLPQQPAGASYTVRVTPSSAPAFDVEAVVPDVTGVLTFALSTDRLGTGEIRIAAYTESGDFTAPQGVMTLEVD